MPEVLQQILLEVITTITLIRLFFFYITTNICPHYCKAVIDHNDIGCIEKLNNLEKILALGQKTYWI